jgi:hypothetical protein
MEMKQRRRTAVQEVVEEREGLDLEKEREVVDLWHLDWVKAKEVLIVKNYFVGQRWRSLMMKATRRWKGIVAFRATTSMHHLQRPL